MQGQSRAGCGRRFAARLAVLALAATTVLVACSPAVALRPRTTPANAVLPAARQDGGGTAQAAALRGSAVGEAGLRERTVALIMARHTAAAGGAADEGPAVAVDRTRMHRAVVLDAQGALAVATLAALAAIVLVVAAVIAGERRQVASRRSAEEEARTTREPGRQLAG